MSFRAATGPRAASRRAAGGRLRAAAATPLGRLPRSRSGDLWRCSVGSAAGSVAGGAAGSVAGSAAGSVAGSAAGSGAESAPRSAPGRKLAEEERAGEHARERGRSAPSLSGAPALRPPPYALLCQRLWRTLGMPAASLFRRLRPPGAVRTQWQERRSYFCRVHGR